MAAVRLIAAALDAEDARSRGGTQVAETRTPAQWSEVARHAARARWATREESGE